MFGSLSLSPSAVLYGVALLAATLLGALILFIVFLVVVASLKARDEHSRVPSELPWVGKERESFASLKANWRGLIKSIPLYLEGYTKVGWRRLFKYRA